ncbi:MAG: two-component transcriptional regulator [Candidatus Berkelbacteria bacterium Licking1014_96]|uniref:Two-component transcriptional regulator n=1 Tax=Candidatus Berkelbacteria bacterium Licking1014_96 TaxID=2017149 RepID=A0A554LEY2_9BACT|nr:MAG: two-component transcriptional regulator [Candidatus Berkelbacteria bacterium Licking1014_96]
MIILVVEDEKKIASFVRRALELEKYTVEIASSGEEALEKIEINDYDLIILDVMLPGIDGFKVCSKLRRLKISTPLIMLTAKTQIADRIRGLDAGADDYLTKPFSIDELLARVRSLLRRGKKVIKVKLKVSDLTLDPKSHEVCRGKICMNLTAKEYKILDFLMRREGEVCTRNMIGEHVWGYNFNPLSNVIDAHLSNLRKKIDAKNKIKLIETARGNGYKIKNIKS